MVKYNKKLMKLLEKKVALQIETHHLYNELRSKRRNLIDMDLEIGYWVSNDTNKFEDKQFFEKKIANKRHGLFKIKNKK